MSTRTKTGADAPAVSASKRYQKRSQAAEIWRRLKKNKGAMVGLAVVCILVFVALFADFLVDYDTAVAGQNIMERLQWPSLRHPMGTDEMGRDLFARVLYGTRISLAVGLVAVAVALAFGVTLGAIAGYFGGVVEDVIMRITDIFAAVPNILMGIVIVAALGANTINLMIAVGVTSIPMKQRYSKRVLALVLAAALLLALAACGGQTNSQPPSSQGSSEVSGSEPATGTSYKENIVVASDKKLTNQDPQSVSNGSHRILFHLTHDGLTYANPETNALELVLAESYTLSDDTLTYTIKLRQGVTFHDGSPFTADDVVFTFERGRESAAGAYRTVFESVEEIKALDDYTVEITLKKPNIDFLYSLTNPGFGMLSRTALEKDPEHGASVGCGPWKYKEFVDGDYVLLERFDDYYGEKAKAKTLKLACIPEGSARLIALQNGEIDLCQDPNNSELGIIADDPNLELIQFDSMAETYLAINVQKAPVDNKALRQAIAYALNLDEIILGAWDGYAVKANSTWGWSQKGFNDKVAAYPQDLDKARALMAEAGYANGVDIEIITNNTQRVTAATIIQSQLKQIGINVTVTELDSAGMTSQLSSDDFQIAVYDNNWFCFADDGRRLYAANSSSNNANYVNERIQELLDLGAAEPDEAKRMEYYHEIQEISHEDCAYIPLVYASKAIATVKGLGGVTYDPGTSHDYSNIYVLE